MSIKKELLLYHHLGLGDHIICNGLVRYFSQQHNIKLLSKKQNCANINIMYSDVKNIKIAPVNDDFEARSLCCDNNCLKIGFCTGAPFYTNVLWDEMFYVHGNIPFDYSWSYFHYPRDHDLENSIYNRLIKDHTHYAFVHNLGSDGNDCIDYKAIDPDLTVIKSDSTINLFAYTKILENASQIHCINSSFIHLIDRININNNTELFYHKNFKLKPFSDFTLKKHWIVI